MCAVQTKPETNAHVVLMDAMKDLKTEFKDVGKDIIRASRAFMAWLTGNSVAPLRINSQLLMDGVRKRGKREKGS